VIAFKPGWVETTLGDICEFKYGKSMPTGKRHDGNYLVYGSNGPVGTHTSSLTNGPTIVIGRKGSFGEITYSELPCWPIDTTYYVDASATSADLKWLAYRLKDLGLTQLNRAAAIPGLNRKDAYEKKLLLPPLDEQRQIADLLDRTNRLRTERQAAVGLLDDLASSIFVEAFGWSHGSASAELGDYLSFVTSGSRGWAKYYTQSGSRFIRSLDVRMNEISNDAAVYVSPPDNAEAKRTMVRTGDVLLTITGSLIGRVAPVTADLAGSYISQHVAILRIDQTRMLPEFLSFFLSLPTGGQRQIANLHYGQTKPGLNFEQIREFKVPAQSITQQRSFVQKLAKVKEIVTLHREHLARLDELFVSLQYRAFSGAL
jgi:type I restriction enzyme S subunit